MTQPISFPDKQGLSLQWLRAPARDEEPFLIVTTESTVPMLYPFLTGYGAVLQTMGGPFKVLSPKGP